MSIENLDKIFQPKSIAVVGASERKGSVGAALMCNLLERGFTGEIHPINPNHKKIAKLPACPSIRDLEVPVDLAVIATPITSVPQIVKDCVDVGVGGAVIISAGGKEIGEQGKKLEAAIQKEARHSGLRIIGPNCVGIMSGRSKLNASFANQMPLTGKLAFISQSGAICTAILDLSIKENIGFSYFVSLGDMLGEAKPELYRKVVEICLNAKEINGLLIISAPQALADTAEVAAALVDIIRDKPIPIITSWVGGVDMQKGRDIFNQAVIPTFDTPERAVRAFMDIYRFSKNIEMLQQIPSRLPKRLEFDRPKAKALIKAGLSADNGLLTEVESKALLSAYGIPVDPIETANSGEEAVQKATKIGFPLVMKINSRDITHKSDAGCVLLDLKNKTDVADGFETIVQNARLYDSKARIDGVTVQPMLTRPDYELILGAKKDRDFGPVILFGMGGIFTEVIKDRAIAFPPLNRLLAKWLMEQTRVYQLLQGYRNIPPANLELLEEILIRLAQLVTDFSEIEEFDFNPLFITENDACVVDARVLLKPPQTQAPLHLVISPYPDQYEEHTQTSTGIDIFVRPIRPEDAPLLVELFESLSPQSVYRRFFTPMKRLPHSMLALFTQIDYDRHIALVALSVSKSKESMLGVARVILERNQKEAEFSIVVGDPWQGKGIGAALLQRCLSIAKERGIENVMGTVLAENTQMLALGKKLGFKIKKVLGVGEYELSIDFQTN